MAKSENLKENKMKWNWSDDQDTDSVRWRLDFLQLEGEKRERRGGEEEELSTVGHYFVAFRSLIKSKATNSFLPS